MLYFREAFGFLFGLKGNETNLKPNSVPLGRVAITFTSQSIIQSEWGEA